jgi:hypothetical protein
MSATAGIDHEQTFALAWADPGNTRFERPPVDVNAVLAKHYHLSRPAVFTRAQLWDTEVRKAFRPDIFIPTTVEEGSAGTWDVRDLGGGHQSFYRRTRQRQQFVPGFDLVLEAVRVNPDNGKVTFIGAPALPGEKGAMLQAGTRQPLFHVEHVASGTVERPINEWRVVFLTDEPNQQLLDNRARRESVYLPQFIEIYIRTILNIELTRR